MAASKHTKRALYSCQIEQGVELELRMAVSNDYIVVGLTDNGIYLSYYDALALAADLQAFATRLSDKT